MYGRFVTQLVRPALQWAVNLLAAWCDAHEKYWVMSDEIVVAGQHRLTDGAPIRPEQAE